MQKGKKGATSVKKTHPSMLPDYIRYVLSIVLMMAWTAISVISSQIMIGLILASLVGQSAMTQPIWTSVHSGLSGILAMIMTIMVPCSLKTKWSKLSKEEDINRTKLGLKGLPTWTDIGLAPVGFVIYIILAAALVAIFNSFSWFDAAEQQNVGFSLFLTGMDRAIAFITLVVIAPITEEVIFRGWLYGKMREKISEKASNLSSIVISSMLVSILFGVIHMQWNVGVNVFALSLVLCALREITGTIYAGILLHMLKNGVAFFLLYFVGIV